MPRAYKSKVGLLVIGLGTLAAPLDTAVNVALPDITQGFGLTLGDIRWVVVVYLLTYASLMLVFGRLGDLIGYRQIFQLGLLAGALGLVACSVAPTYEWLLIGRIVQGVGVALILSCGPALAMSLLPDDRRDVALAFYVAVTAAGAALGPLLGGLFLAYGGWQAVFWFRVPLLLGALALSKLVAPAQVPRAASSFDAIGAMLVVACMGALLLAVTFLFGSHGLRLPVGLGLFSLMCLALLLLRGTQHAPMIPLAPFRRADFALMNAASIAVNLTAFGILVLVLYYCVQIAGLDVVRGGLVLAIGAAGAVFGSWCTGLLARRARVSLLALAGTALCVAGLFAISMWSRGVSVVILSLSLFAHGAGVGMFQVAYSDLVTGRLPLADRGVAGSLTIVTRTVGGVVGATYFAAAHGHFESAALLAGAGPADAFLAAFQKSFAQTALGLCLFLLLSLARPSIWSADENRAPGA
jgi:MFS family permease